MINQRFVVQVDRHTVGIAVRVPGGFMFYASDDAFDEMDGHIFTRARAIERELTRVTRRRKHSARVQWKSPFKSPDPARPAVQFHGGAVQ